MAGILYFKPEHQGPVTAEHIREWGLGYAFQGAPTVGGTMRGPTVGELPLPPGVIFGDQSMPVADMALNPEKQTWAAMPGKPGIYCGFWNDRRPTPKDLARPRQLPGYKVRLNDDQEYLIPLARGLAPENGDLPPLPYCALPRISTLDNQGQWVRGGVAAKYRALWEEAIAWLDTIDGKQRDDEFAALHRAAVLALSTHYRLDDAEVSMLGLLDDRTCVDVMYEICDGRQLEAWTAKKQAAAGSNSIAGPAA